MLAIATTDHELAAIEDRLAEFDLDSLTVAKPSEVRLVLLAALTDDAATERVARTLRAEGLMAVTRPDGGSALGAWLRDTRPVTVAEKLTVCPAWSEHDRGGLPAVLELGPGGFGSGHHPTTLMILEELAARIEGGERVLDVGCGSGVLALGSLRLGAGSAVAIDLKSEAIEAARRNAGLNEMTERLQATSRPLGEFEGRFDVVVANIARAGIVALAPHLVASVAPGGWLAVSGITPAQCSLVAEFLQPLAEVTRRECDDWSALVFEHPRVR
jgi:ribosomal protein L11 methyltransferase